jgi:hypothetical protein
VRLGSKVRSKTGFLGSKTCDLGAKLAILGAKHELLLKHELLPKLLPVNLLKLLYIDLFRSKKAIFILQTLGEEISGLKRIYGI